jgi:hypothetical protein
MEGQVMMPNCVGDVERTTKDNNNEHEWELGNIRFWYDAKDVDPKLGEGVHDIKNGNGKAKIDGVTRIDDGEKNHR